MREMFLVLFLCVGCGVGEVSGEEKREVEVVCEHPRGHVEVYRVLVRSLYELTRSRSAMWNFRGKRLRDGKLVEVVANDCYVEREVK
jgi:hypothetical protein